MLGAACLLWGALSGDDLFFAGPEAAARGLHPLRDPAWGAAAGALMVALSRVVSERTRAGAAASRALGGLLGRLGPGECLLLALASGIAEELLFRGIVQPRLGLVTTSLLFGLAHFVPRRVLAPWTASAVLAGFVLGGLFAATGNLAAPVAAHVTVNALNLRWLARRFGDVSDR